VTQKLKEKNLIPFVRNFKLKKSKKTKNKLFTLNPFYENYYGYYFGNMRI